jgi:arylsulfatase A-like enzyme
MDLRRVVFRILSLASLTLPLSSCSGSPSDSVVLAVEEPLRLSEHLGTARIIGSEVPAEALQSIEWRFDEPQPDWRSTSTLERRGSVEASYTGDALRVRAVRQKSWPSRERPVGAVYVELPGLDLQDWAHVEVRARARGPVWNIGLAVNHDQQNPQAYYDVPFVVSGRGLPVITDGVVHSYRLDWEKILGTRPDGTSEELSPGPVTHLGVFFNSARGADEAAIEILSITVVSKAALYADVPSGIVTVRLGNRLQRAILGHAPGRLEYQIGLPESPRLDLALGVLREDQPVTFRVDVAPLGSAAETLLEEVLTDPSSWVQHTVDLSAYAGQEVTVGLETEAEAAGAVGFWGAPTLSGSRATGPPNVIFYVIDGAGADWMSLYGYNRRTTPFLERLAGEAVVFENAYSNATSTPLSTPSYMTSLLYSAIDRYRSYSDKIPDGVTTMAEHFGRVGYQTGVFASNPQAATASGLERGVDLVRMLDPPVPAVSSEHLHRAFWDWREAYPGTPYWAHFQTTDVHEPFRPMAPFSGLFITPERRAKYIEWDESMGWIEYAARDTAAVARHALAQQALYDEGMAHQDHHLERFVERLKAEGRWENTILVIASDHGYPAGSHRSMPGHPRGAPHIHPFATRVPLMFVWPGHIEGGRRIRTPVSMIDVLPTLLDLTGLPQPQVRQGSSLAPLLLGQVTEEEWEPHPVFVDVLVLDRISGEMVGNIEVIDGRWGAALCVRPGDPEAEVHAASTGDALTDCTATVRERLLVYDLWDDPLLERPINKERPDLVERYTKLLETQVEVNAALRELISGRGQSVELRAEDLEQLRALGYIQ